jgi:hypothetical protein
LSLDSIREISLVNSKLRPNYYFNAAFASKLEQFSSK